MKIPEVTLEMTPCTHCGMLLHLPFLMIDDRPFCGWEHYALWRNRRSIEPVSPPAHITNDNPATTEHE